MAGDIVDLTFSAKFTDTTAFPTGPHPGRNDLQKLHNETADHINNVLKPAIKESASSARGAAFTWSGTIPPNSKITITHNLGRIPIIPVPFGDLGNIHITFNAPTDNTVEVYNYSGNNEWTGTIRMF